MVVQTFKMNEKLIWYFFDLYYPKNKKLSNLKTTRLNFYLNTLTFSKRDLLNNLKK